MSLGEKCAILKEIPFFAGLSLSQQKIIAEKACLTEYKKNQIIYEEGSPASALYCIVVGRVKIYTRDPQGAPHILEYLHRGKYFGIISLLTNEPHSVTAEAMNDCLLLVIPQKDFEYILHKAPELAIDFGRTLSRRLKRKDTHHKMIFESTVVAVFSSYSQAGKTEYALNLALSLHKETHKSVVILDIAPEDKTHSLPGRVEADSFPILHFSSESAADSGAVYQTILKDRFGVDLACFHYTPDDEISVKRVIEFLSLLVNDYHYLILDLPSSMDRTIFSILKQSDVVHLLTSPERIDLQRTANLIRRLKDDGAFPEEKIQVLINEYKASALTVLEQADILKKPVFATLPKIDLLSSKRLILEEPECEYSKAIRRISRQVGDCLVGLVLGVGVGYGFCHIGVLKVIEEEKIPIDVIAGASIGSLIASLWVTGRSSTEILKITGEFKDLKHLWNLVDLTFPFHGFIKGNKLRAFLKRHLGNRTFQDIRLPLKIIASDVKRKETRLIDKGLLVDAIMASCSMPGVFTPFWLKEEMLFDGGVANPLPTEPLCKLGVKKIIAVNVTPSREDILRQYEKIKKDLSDTVHARPGFSLRRFFRERFKINILDIIFSSVEMLQSEVARQEEKLADVVLHPDTSGLYWLEIHRAEEFARRGEEEARRNLDKIWQVVNE
ncbi:MAG: cyclic nucleotide-binding domain-containing protein [Candidatus Omnitrophica bacterium]|nr:cyclic nucleotide-binding domain-containing protein [Candidatus Omnitrophota bacterium]